MKRIGRLCILVLTITLCSSTAQGQFLKKLGKKAQKAAERTIERRVENEASKKTDQTLDSILEPRGGNQRTPQDKGSKDGNNQREQDMPTVDSPNTTSGNEVATENPALEIYSKFDFVPGDKTLFFDDFSNDFIGDFPAKWNTDGGGEVVTIGEDNWFGMKMSSYFVPDVGPLPEEYTIEFDLYTTGLDSQTSSQAMLHVILDESDNFGYGKNVVYAYLPFCQYIAQGIRMWGRKDGKVLVDNRISADIREIIKGRPHVSIAVNKQRFRLWINETKYVDIPRIVSEGKINTLKLEPVGFKDGKEQLFITNVKVSEGGIDLRRKLIAEGKISTNGILFKSGSATLKPESMGIIRQIYQVLQQDANLSLSIVGHTDSDGSDAMNMELSKKRADAVKTTLVTVYGVAGDRLLTEGKGASEPVADNTSADGKAQNRRVEFIKQ
ncbi:Outer membrane protein-like peptidoglycan-associated (lipo)protein [Croceitalea dokdonensis DOKDO 023]|uniref:Outer membrane protein-like peptidoglycan-associated (Lipo)protein n=1 Tax=Croceitalea dokdonensis DOKDO 023 TaxID=1300341 RepID=A0A0P7AX43_9FLAO|nr:OmpA family protein [Croceitalea dokdonensis]KPM32610.1 Outer membrane protein-like peptidoglycan-associated (lipo)protein [Croceitalea dokdonensis DOKDO 023]